MLTSDWCELAISEYLAMCDALGIEDTCVPATVWMHESACRANAHNLSGDASGIFQLMPATAKAIGWDVANDPALASFRALDVLSQLAWARRYYAPHTGKLGSVGRFYVATFLPALTEHGDTPQFILCASQGPFAWAYRANAGFDRSNKGYVVVDDLVNAALRAASSPRGRELLDRIRIATKARDVDLTDTAELPAMAMPDVTPDAPNTDDDPQKSA